MLSFGLACSDSTTPTSHVINTDAPPPGVTVLTWTYPDSIKYPSLGGSATMIGSAHTPSPTVMTSPAAAFVASEAPASYTLATVLFAPEEAPVTGMGPSCDDCLWIDNPIGFTFKFFGQSYDKINIGSNGIIGFGVDNMRDGCCQGILIPSNDFYNNVIALGQNDWMPNAVQKAIRYETRGTAPNRRYVLQYTNVPEGGGNGRLTVQIVLSEGSNDITIYTTSLSTTLRTRLFTQGIENSNGTEAEFVAGRVQSKFTLINDAIRFSPINPNQVPAVTAPANLSANTDAGVCSAVVAVGMATGSDDAPGFNISSARSDGLALDAAYPKGVTTITWTATDVEGLTASAAQTITVSDTEKPTVVAPANVVAGSGAGLSAGTATTGDNCPNVQLVGSRSDFLGLGEPYPLGVTSIVWTAIDASLNTASAVQTVTVRDTEAPSLSVPVSFTVNATMPTGAVVSYVATSSDNVGVTAQVCDHQSGSVFPMGATLVSCTANDAGGNSATASFTVTVLDAPEQIVAMLEFIRGLPIPEPGRTQLIDALTSALGNPHSCPIACPALNLFKSIVQARTPAVFSVDKSAQIIADATRIQSVLGCP
jgi:hypothetical protein